MATAPLSPIIAKPLPNLAGTALAAQQPHAPLPPNLVRNLKLCSVAPVPYATNYGPFPCADKDFSRQDIQQPPRDRVHTHHAFRAFVVFAHALHKGLEHDVVHEAHNGQLRDGRGTYQKFERLSHFGFQAHMLMLSGNEALVRKDGNSRVDFVLHSEP